MSVDRDYLMENLLDEDNLLSEGNPLSNPKETTNGPYRLVIALDYGTDYTSVAFATSRSENISLEEIDVVTDWGPSMGNQTRIPSVISYSPTNDAIALQWGSSLSSNAIVMANTKTELDVQDSKLEELKLLLQVLDGMCNLDFENVKKSRGYPEYTWKDPEEIVTDYLTKVFQCVNQKFQHFGDTLIAQIPVDIVLTVPVNWSYRGKNSFFRAVKKAGFNEHSFPNLQSIIMVADTEAAARYSQRCLQEIKQAESLKLGECFIICVANERSVDVVSYRVIQLEPVFNIEQVAIAANGHCGSMNVNVEFKKWLQQLIGERNYRTLDPRYEGQISHPSIIETAQMQRITRSFDVFKRDFAEESRDAKLDLPKPLEGLNVASRVVDGELTITHDEMASFFDSSINGIVELLSGEIQQVERMRNRVRSVFLVGDYEGECYLQQELSTALQLRNISLRCPEANKSTANVRGAVLCGVMKNSQRNLMFGSSCPKSYGIVLDETHKTHTRDFQNKNMDLRTYSDLPKKRLTWLIHEGDWIPSDEDVTFEKMHSIFFKENDDRKVRMPIYEYEDDDGYEPEHFNTASNELIEVAILTCDLSDIPIPELERFENTRTNQSYYAVNVNCKMRISGRIMDVSVQWGARVLCRVNIAYLERV